VKNIGNLLKSLITVVVLVIAGIQMGKTELPAWVVALVWGVAFWYGMELVIALLEKFGIRNVLSQYTTYDIMVMAVLIAAGGVLKAYWAQLRMVLESIMGPYATWIIGPGFYFWGILACHLVRRPLSGTISMVLGGVVEIMADPISPMEPSVTRNIPSWWRSSAGCSPRTLACSTGGTILGSVNCRFWLS